MLTRKHFIDMAQFIRLAHDNMSAEAVKGMIALALWLARNNPRFDQSRFEAACQPQEKG